MGDTIDPITPHHGQRFSDDLLHPVFSLLRGKGYLKELKQFKTAQEAMDHLYRIDRKLLPGSTAQQHGSYAETDPKVVAFLSNNATTHEHWRGLFGMLHEAGFQGKDVMRAALNCIERMKSPDPSVPLTHEDLQDILYTAHEELKEVYKHVSH